MMHGVHRTLPEHAVRLPAVVMKNVPTPRIGRVAINAHQSQSRRVGVAGVIRRIHHADRIVRRDLVQLVPEQHVVADNAGFARREPESPDPLTGRTARSRRRERVEHRSFVRPTAAGGSRPIAAQTSSSRSGCADRRTPEPATAPSDRRESHRGRPRCEPRRCRRPPRSVHRARRRRRRSESMASIVSTRPPVNSNSMFGSS